MLDISKEWIYYVIIALNFYLLPMLISDTGSAMFILLLLMPLLLLVTSYLYGKKNGFQLKYLCIVAILFIPTIYIHYNNSAWIYTAIYVIIAAIGSFAAKLFKK